jgi:hypothetical protein
VKEDGKPDTAHSLNNDRIDATSGDIEELADTFARRLMSWTFVEDLFADITEARRNRIEEAVAALRKR